MIELIATPPEFVYHGDCDEYGRRNGFGVQSWQHEGKEQEYNGQFFQDCMHGEGSYVWIKGKGKEYYEGNFYSNAKEGYGVVSMQDKATFEGLFCNNRAFGPGVLTYENGRQDAGFWRGTKIVRLSRVVDCIVPRLASSLDGKIKLFPYRRILYLHEESDVTMEVFGESNECASCLYSSFLSDCRSLFFNRINYDKVYFKNLEHFQQSDLINESHLSTKKELDADKMEVDVTGSQSSRGSVKSDVVNNNDLKHEALENDSAIKLVCWNRSDICAEMLKQIFYFRSFEEKLSFKISNLIEGNRTAFKKTGHKEKDCIHFLKACSAGPAFVIREFLCCFNISEELMDARGNNGLMFAAANDQHEIIDILLDHGVDVDSFNDEHLTALNLCLLRLISQTYKILNWEIAFLPPKTDDAETMNGLKFEVTRSIKSLDRVFGDGMSLIENEMDLNLIEMEGEGGDYFGNDSEFKKDKCKVSESIWKLVPELFKTDEYLDSVAKPTEKDKYFFDLSPEPDPQPLPPVSPAGKKQRKGKPLKENVVQEVIEVEEEPEDKDKIEKCENIEKTIRKLLARGADPNLSEVPKASIHLGVFARSVKVVDMLLKFGASANTRSNFSEGFLTPLHIVVLTKPAEEFIDICEILLQNGGDPEAETTPEFNPNGEREIFLDPKHGRTPLQLLCMRPDLEYADPKGYLIEIALLLSQVSNKKRRFKGYNCLTLAMLRGNVKLVEAFLKTGSFDPNEILKTHGTPLHVLVSTFLQIRVPYEKSLKMCDLLLDSGANPLKNWRQGGCVDYGYREIDKEKERRTLDKKKDKNKGRDHLKDHIKIVEYLQKKAKITSKEAGIDSEKDVLEEVKEKFVKEKKRIGKEKAEVEEKGNEKEKVVKEVKEIKEMKRRGVLESKRKIGDAKEEESGGRGRIADKEVSQIFAKENGRTTNEDDKKAERQIEKVSVNISSGKKEIKNIEDIIQTEKQVKKEKSYKDVKGEVKEVNDDKEDKNETRNRHSVNIFKAQSDTVNENTKRKREISVEHVETKKKTKKGKESKKLAKKEKLILPLKKLPMPKEKFERIPEPLQQLLFQLLGHCRDVFNINDLLLPYVVLRNGDLYYRFKGQKPKNIEAYSLI